MVRYQYYLVWRKLCAYYYSLVKLGPLLNTLDVRAEVPAYVSAG